MLDKQFLMEAIEGCAVALTKAERVKLTQALFKAVKLRLRCGVSTAYRKVLLSRADEIYATTEIEVDTDAGLSVGEDGTWVQGWLWVPTGKGWQDRVQHP